MFKVLRNQSVGESIFSRSEVQLPPETLICSICHEGKDLQCCQTAHTVLMNHCNNTHALSWGCTIVQLQIIKHNV